MEAPIAASVVLCTYNRCPSLLRTLQSVAEFSLPPHLAWELVLIDNNSSDGTRRVIEDYGATAAFPVRYVFEGRQGLAHARNAGIQAARGEILAFTDDDMRIDRNWLSEIVGIFERFDCVAVGGKIELEWHCPQPSWLDLDWSYPLRGPLGNFDLGEQEREIQAPPFGGNMAFRRQAFATYGLFRPDLGRSAQGLGLGEETEFFRRILAAGGKLVYAPKAVVHHPVGPERARQSFFQRYFFNYGRYLAREPGFPPDVVHWFGVPRYLFRSSLESGLRWLLSWDERKRLRHKLQACIYLGQISEARHSPTRVMPDSPPGGHR